MQNDIKKFSTIKRLLNTILAVSIFVIAVSLSNPLVVVAADSEPEVVLKKGVNSIVEVLNDNKFSDPSQKNARKDILFNIAETFFDFNEFSRGALGQNWRRFSNVQQSEFSKHFARLMANTYIAKIDDENFKDLKITYTKTEIIDATKSGIERAEISTEVFHNNVVTPVHYRMMKKSGASWKIYDVKIEGVSLVGNYREQYRTRFNDSPEKIIQEIKDKVAQ